MSLASSYLRLAAVAAALQLACGGGGGSSATTAQPPVQMPPPGPAWNGYGGDAQHTAIGGIAGQSLAAVHWSTPVDLLPQHNADGELLIHYGSPAITTHDTVLVPVKTGAGGGFSVQARNGVNGALIWQVDSGYVLPPIPSGGWTPPYGPVLTGANRLYFPGSGGRLNFRDDPDSASGAVQSVVFYGAAAYSASPSAYDDHVMVSTPLTADAAGTLYFGFEAVGATPANLVSGIARVDASGHGSWISASAAANHDASILQVVRNCAPALSKDGSTVYLAVRDANLHGALVALDSATLAFKSKAALTDPVAALPALLSEDGTASPAVGPDGDVYFGVLENHPGDHNYRGWLLHFDAALATLKLPGSFGWDDTPSIVPASMVPSYTGASIYLLMTKYNNYAGAGTGDGQNKVAVLDPNAPEADPVTPAQNVMKEVLTALGPTPDPDNPGGVREWCINTAVVDPLTKSIYVNNEDGWMYRWDMTTKTLAEKRQLTSGLGEAYTPTIMGPDGRIYGINNAVLFSLGN